jgi:hypothetical protein
MCWKVLFQCITLSIRFSPIMFKAGAENTFSQPLITHHIQKIRCSLHVDVLLAKLKTTSRLHF